MPRELPLDGRAIADEQQPDLQMTRRNEGTVDNGSRTVVAAHGVDCDAHAIKVLKF
jgi:hypothetical protein